ncbi:3'(2'),5'-bisphosphate nucleotidase CysQ [Pelagerythrobacter marensis]|uniref:3'(2'),5'-bisphosphate nucleotidase CysQ n=1 Tax=Pelagerythrobacter marensis TaxID=543877 RepID=A0ABZ2D6B8_9SPHN
MTDAELAAHLARIAGRILIEVRESAMFEGKQLGSAGDEVSNRYLLHALRAQRPDDGILSEESRDTLTRLDKDRVWIIDPVDGTREYGEARTDWAVHVGLSIEGEAAAGAVALPDLNGGEVLRSDRVAPLPPAADRPRLVVSRTRPAKQAEAVAQAIGGELVAMGSAGAKAMAVVRGAAEIYLHTGGQYQWDNCAPVAVAAAHGLHCSRIDGSPLRYNGPDTSLPDVLICRPEWAERVLEAVRQTA